jgi:head-tail adaptor
MRGPKVSLTLYKYTLASDGGGGQTKSWSAIANIRGALTLVKSDEQQRTDREVVHIRYQFWCSPQKGIFIEEEDEFVLLGKEERFRVQFVDDILEKNDMLKIDLIRIQ